MINRLKPCPFCGSTNIYVTHASYYDSEDTVCVFCNACKQYVILENNNAEGINDKTRERAIEAWNARAPYEAEGYFFLPKPKERLYDVMPIEVAETETGYTGQFRVKILEDAAKRWATEINDEILHRIIECWKNRGEE